MIRQTFDTSGRLRERWDDGTRTYTAWNSAGAQTSTRAYTTAENTLADERAAASALDANRRSIETALEAALGELQTIIDASNATINSGPAPYIKILARIVRRIIRLVIRRFDGSA